MRLSSFKHAIHGIYKANKLENNFNIMLVCFLLVLITNILLKITPLEWIITLMCSGIVLSLELINSAIEKTIDYITDEHHPLLCNAKDYAAGASLVMSAISFIVALIIYLPYVLAFLGI